MKKLFFSIFSLTGRILKNFLDFNTKISFKNLVLPFIKGFLRIFFSDVKVAFIIRTAGYFLGVFKFLSLIFSISVILNLYSFDGGFSFQNVIDFIYVYFQTLFENIQLTIDKYFNKGNINYGGTSASSKILETERLVSEAENFELDAIKSKLEVSNAKIAINRENAECANSPEAFNKATEDLFEETGKNVKLLDRAIDILSKKFTDSGSDVIENIKEIFNNYINFLDTLTLHQLGSLANLLAAIFILFCLFSVIVIIYSNIILNYLKLEEKFPRLANFIHYRKKFQNFFLFINLLLIVITLLSTIFVNLSALIS